MANRLSELGASVMSLFQSAPPQQNSGQLGATVTTGANGLPKEGSVDIKAPEGEPGKEKPPLAEFADLFKMPEPDPKKSAPVVEPDPLSFDPAKLTEVSRKLDFTAGIDAALLAKAKGGDPDAQMQVMALSNQNAFAQAVHAISGVAKKALEKQARDLAKSMPETVRASATAAALREANPLYSDPAFAPVVDTLSSQLRIKHPDATPAEITAHVNKYLDGVAASLKSGKPPAGSSGKGTAGKHGTEPADWGDFFLGTETSQ